MVTAFPSLLMGLSPRVRGSQPDSRPVPVFLRSIPACAGEPLSVLFLLPNLPGGCASVVLHQVGAVGVDYLFGRLSEKPYSLAANR